MRLTGIFTVIFLGLLILTPVQAHESRPAYLEITETTPNQYRVLWRTPVLAGNKLLVVLKLPEGVTDTKPPIIQELSDSLVERRWINGGTGGLSGKKIEFQGLQLTITDVLARIEMLDGRKITVMAGSSDASITIPKSQSWWEVASTFVIEGIKHIAMGIDHLLFVAALMLIVRNWLVLVQTITAFTIAHSITLTSATMGWITLPVAPVEAMIALSILLVACEVIRLERGKSSITITWPWVVAFLFGLLHGFGFAGALVDLGLPQTDIPLALLSFNIGVEIGQLCFIGILLVVVYGIRRIIPLQSRAVVGAAYLIGTAAAFWSIERLSAMLL
jgi:hydrogenase/urease accessory protein HupE